MHTKITEQTTLDQIDQQLQDYELVLSRVYVDADGYNVTLAGRDGSTIALGMAPSFYAALEDAFQDVDGLAVLDTRHHCAAAAVAS